MKKMLLGLLLLSSLCFANWRTVELLDEFEDKTGAVATGVDLDKGFIRIDKKVNGVESIYLYPDAYVGGTGKYSFSMVGFKIDSNKPVYLIGNVTKDGKKVSIDNEFTNERYYPKVIAQMKAGNNLKISIEKYDGTSILRKTNLKNFTASYSKIRRR